MACIVSVMLGVATLIVVNSVMGGFSTKLKDRLHGLLSDIVIESHDYNGFADYERKMELIRSDPFLNERIEAMAPTLEIFAMLQYNYQGSAPRRSPGRSASSASTRRAGAASAASPNTSLRTRTRPVVRSSPPEVLKRQRDLHRGDAGFHLAPPEPPLDLPRWARSRPRSRRRARSSSPRA